MTGPLQVTFVLCFGLNVEANLQTDFPLEYTVAA